jgi:hypothetical protein
MTTVRLDTLHPAAATAVQALIEADMAAKGASDAERAAMRRQFADAQRRRDVRAAEDRATARRELARRFPSNPYLRDEGDWNAYIWASDRRETYLYSSDAWKRRRSLAHDLRTQDGDVTVEMKRRYQWAEDAFRTGYLSARVLHAEAVAFDQAVVERRHLAHQMTTRRREGDASKVWIRKEVRRLSQMSLRDGYTDRDAWAFVHERAREQKELERQWQAEREARRESMRQWAALQEGKRTLADIRRHLRGQDRSQQPESPRGRTSRTS